MSFSYLACCFLRFGTGTVCLVRSARDWLPVGLTARGSPATQTDRAARRRGNIDWGVLRHLTVCFLLTGTITMHRNGTHTHTRTLQAVTLTLTQTLQHRNLLRMRSLCGAHHYCSALRINARTSHHIFMRAFTPRPFHWHLVRWSPTITTPKSNECSLTSAFHHRLLQFYGHI